jgi:hypothetical protein
MDHLLLGIINSLFIVINEMGEFIIKINKIGIIFGQLYEERLLKLELICKMFS